MVFNNVKYHIIYKMINNRREKGHTEMIYLREVRKVSDLNREYDVLGSSGNTYTLWIHKNPSCTCPDFNGRSIRCKHIYYVLNKILNVDESLIDKESFSEDDLKLIFDKHNDQHKIFNTIQLGDSDYEKKEDEKDISYFETIYNKIFGFTGCMNSNLKYE